jgi:hypothetical protein
MGDNGKHFLLGLGEFIGYVEWLVLKLSCITAAAHLAITLPAIISVAVVCFYK